MPQNTGLQERARDETPFPVHSLNAPLILPQILFGGSSTFGNVIPRLRFSMLNIPHSQARRLFSSGGKGEKKIGAAEEGTTETSISKGKDNKITDATKDAATEREKEALDPRTFFLGTRESLRKVTEWEAGDMMATYSIALLLGLILISPVVSGYMRGSESTYDELDTDDPVVDMTRIIRDYKISEDGALEDKGVVDTLLADVLSSKALQEQATKFVITILESKDVKAAGQRFLKDLWDDLIKNPETTAQIIFLLNVAIQNDDIRLAVKKLVLELVEDEEVLEELVRLLQKLGQDQEVLDATKTLLSESAHNALNDPEVLDHSMEFATDVVGDDVVQRTAGEALRNTLSYAVKPSVTILLATTGVGLLFFSIVALGYATRSSEREAAVFYDAMLGLGSRVWGTVGLPIQALASAVGAFFRTVLLPYHFVQRIVARVEYTGSAVSRALQVATDWANGTARASSDWIAGAYNGVSSYGDTVGGVFYGSMSWISTQSTRMVSCLMRASTGLAAWTFSAWTTLTSFFGGAGSSVEVTMQSLSSWFASASDRVHRQTYARAWVLLGALSDFLLSCKHCFV